VDLNATPSAQIQADMTGRTLGPVAPDFAVSGFVETVDNPRVDNDTSKSPEVINSQPDRTDGQRAKSTRGQGRQKRAKSAPKSTTKKAAKRKAPKAKISKARPPTPEGFEARPRDNRWQLFRLHGKKLSANGNPMWRRTYIGSFTREGLRIFYEREQQRLEDESTRQRAKVVNLSDRKRGGRDVDQRTEPARKANP
jgi:hypothetical protein